MTKKYYQPFCGPAGLNIKSVFGRISANNAFSWFDDSHIYYTHKARTAIRHACDLMELGTDSEILVPSYNCGSELDPLAKSGVHLVLYRIDKNCMIDLADAQDKVTKKTKAIYITHYFGFSQPLREVKQFCKNNNLYLLEDCALSLFCYSYDGKYGTTGDVSFFSFVKTLPTLDGGALIVNNPQLHIERWNLGETNFTRLIKRSLSLLKSGLLRWSPFLTNMYCSYLCTKHQIISVSMKKALQKESFDLPGIPSNYYYDEKMSDKSISIMTRRILERLNSEEIIKRRRDNYTHLLTLLLGNPKINIPFKKLPAGVCPLFFPIIINKRDEVCVMLNRKAIDAIAWWAGYYKNLDWRKYPDAVYLKNSLMALPIHQDLSISDIEYIAKSLIQSMDKV
jgi:dTDP-4-amino-4,6-dideoxygalactose transaminase